MKNSRGQCINDTVKLIFMGTPEFALPALERLIEEGHQVEAVITQPDKPAGRGNRPQPPPVKSLALERGIKVYQPERIRKNEQVLSLFREIAPDACIVVAYGKILPESLLAIPKFGCMNVHASLLPKYRGAAPINWAIANGELETGVTIIKMDAGMDTGPILAARATSIYPEETAPELSARLAKMGAELLAETLPQIELGRITPIPQDDSKATYAPMLKREDGLLDWNMTARQIADRVRGFQPWPGAYTFWRGHRLILWRARCASACAAGAEPSTILRIDDSGIAVACGAGSALLIEELQLEGGRRLRARDFANGFRLRAGDSLLAAS